jgi:maleylpyruvate isomerase
MTIKLYSFWRSTCSWRVRIALAHKGIAYEYVPVHLARDGGEQNTERYRSLNPMRTVPMLELEEGGKPHRLSQSLAILEFLEERYPEPPLLPKGALDRAFARMLAEVVNSGIQPLQNRSVNLLVKDGLKGDEQAWSQHWISRGLEALERLISERGDRFCVGDTVSIADVCLIPQLQNGRRFGVDLAPFRTLTRIEAACQQLPAFQQAHPGRQPDAETQDGPPRP